MWNDKEEVENICPICGEHCDVIYFDKKTGEPVGCDECLDWEYAYEWNEKQYTDNEAVKADYAYDAWKERAC